MEIFQKSFVDEVNLRKFHIQKYIDDLQERRNHIVDEYKGVPLPKNDLKDKLQKIFDIFEEIKYEKEKFKCKLDEILEYYSKYDLKNLEDIQEEDLDENLNEYQYILKKLLRIDNDIQIDTYQIDLKIPKIPKISRNEFEFIQKYDFTLPKDFLKELDYIFIQIQKEQREMLYIRRFGIQFFDLMFQSRLNPSEYNRKFWKYYSLIIQMIKRNEEILNCLKYIQDFNNQPFGRNRFKDYMKKTSFSLSNFILFHYEKYRTNLTEAILRKVDLKLGDYIFEQYHPDTNKLQSIKNKNLKTIYKNSQFYKFKNEKRINQEIIPDEILEKIGEIENEMIDCEKVQETNNITSKNYLFYLLKFQSSYFTDSIIKQIVIEYQRFKLLKYLLKIGYYLKPECIEMIEKNHIFGYSQSNDKKSRFLNHFNQIHYPSWDESTIHQFEVLIFDYFHKMTCKIKNKKFQIQKSIEFCEKERDYLHDQKEDLLKYIKFIKIKKIVH